MVINKYDQTVMSERRGLKNSKHHALQKKELNYSG